MNALGYICGYIDQFDFYLIHNKLVAVKYESPIPAIIF
jgi:hypothetical protein